MARKYYSKYLQETDYDSWNEFVASSPDGSIYSTPEYLDVLCEVVGGRFSILAILQNDEIVGGVALYENDSRFGIYVSPRLLLYYNGLILKHFDTKYPSKNEGRQIEIMSIIAEKLSQQDYARLELKNRDTLPDARVFQKMGWIVEPSYTYIASLMDLDVLWSRIEQNLRRLIKRSCDQGIVFVKGDDFESFYRLHYETHKRKGSPLYLSFDKFKRYYDRLRTRNLCHLYHACLPNGGVISSQFVLLSKHPIAHTVSAATDKAHLNTGVTAFLRWKVFKDLAGMGYQGNDLTDASLNPVSHFKSQLGTDLKVYMVLKKPELFMYHYYNKFYEFISRRKESFKNILSKG